MKWIDGLEAGLKELGERLPRLSHYVFWIILYTKGLIVLLGAAGLLFTVTVLGSIEAFKLAIRAHNTASPPPCSSPALGGDLHRSPTKGRSRHRYIVQSSSHRVPLTGTRLPE